MSQERYDCDLWAIGYSIATGAIMAAILICWFEVRFENEHYVRPQFHQTVYPNAADFAPSLPTPAPGQPPPDLIRYWPEDVD